MTARIVIVLDVEGIDPTLVDPHTVADEVLPEEFIAFAPGRSFVTEDGIRGVFVSAEWAGASGRTPEEGTA